MPLKLKMYNILTAMLMGICQGFVESLLHLIYGRIIYSISLRERSRDKREDNLEVK